MPLRKRDIKGKTLQELKALLNANIQQYYPNEIEKVMTKIEKRLREGDTLADDQMLNEVYDDLNL